MKTIVIVIAMLVAGIAPSIAGESCIPSANPLVQLFPKCKNKTPCVVNYGDSIGGTAEIATAAAAYIKKHNIMVKINGDCPSSCEVFAAFGRPNVCITKLALMRIHIMKQYDARYLHCTAVNGVLQVSVAPNAPIQARNQPWNPKDLAELLEDNYGAPEYNFFVLDFYKAKKYWSVCTN